MQLFTNYDKNAYPLISSGIRTNVSMGLSIIYTDIDEFDGKVMLHGWLHLVSRRKYIIIRIKN